MSVDRNIRYDLIARLCPNATGAELRSVCTEAGMFAIRARRKVATEKDFLEAVEKVIRQGVSPGCCLTDLTLLTEIWNVQSKFSSTALYAVYNVSAFLNYSLESFLTIFNSDKALVLSFQQHFCRVLVLCHHLSVHLVAQW